MPDIYEVRAPDGSTLEIRSDHLPTADEAMTAVRGYGDAQAAAAQKRAQAGSTWGAALRPLAKSALDTLPGIGGLVGGIVSTPETLGAGTIPGVALGTGVGRGVRDVVGQLTGLDEPTSMSQKAKNIATDTAIAGTAHALIPGLVESVKNPVNTLRMASEHFGDVMPPWLKRMGALLPDLPKPPTPTPVMEDFPAPGSALDVDKPVQAGGLTPEQIAARIGKVQEAGLPEAPPRGGPGRLRTKPPITAEALAARQQAADAARAADAAANPPSVPAPKPRPPIPQAQFNEMPLASQMAHLPEETGGGGVLRTRTPIPPVIPQEQTPFSQQPLAVQMDRLPETPAPEVTRGVEPPIQNLGNEAPTPTPFNERPLQEQMSELPTTGGEPSSRVPTPPIIPQPEPATPFHELPLQQQMDQLPTTGGVPSARTVSPPTIPQTPFNELPLHRQMEQLPTTGEAPELPRGVEPRAQNLGQETGPNSLLSQPGVLRTRPILAPDPPTPSVGDKPPVSPTPDVGTSQAPEGPDLSSVLSNLPQSSGLADEPNIGLNRGTGEIYRAQPVTPDAPPNPHGDLSPEVIRELRQMAAEQDNLRYGGRNFNETYGRGGDLEVSGGAGGAEVHQDIKEAGGYLKRAGIKDVIDQVIDGTGKPSANTKAVIKVAGDRASGQRGLARPPGLPDDAADFYETPAERTAREARGELPPNMRNAQTEGPSMRDQLIEQIRAHAAEQGVTIDEDALQRELGDKDQFLGDLVKKYSQGGESDDFEFGDTPVDKTAAGDQPRLAGTEGVRAPGKPPTMRAPEQASDDTFSLDDRTNAQKALDEERAAREAQGPGMFDEPADRDALTKERAELGSAQTASNQGMKRTEVQDEAPAVESGKTGHTSGMMPSKHHARIQAKLQDMIDSGASDEEIRNHIDYRADGKPSDPKTRAFMITLARTLGRPVYGLGAAAAGGAALRSALVNQLNQDGKQ
jgi:hypothetical protein